MQDVDWNNLREAQQAIHSWANRTFPKRTDHGALTKLVLEEIPELLQHKKEHGTAGIGPELADAFILLLDLALMWGVDVPSAISAKMQINDRRMWSVDPTSGIAQHVVIKQTIEDKHE